LEENGTGGIKMKLRKLISLFLALALVTALTGLPALAESAMTLKTTASVNLRKGPDTSYSVIKSVASGKKFTYLGISAYDAKGRLWHKISYNSSSAWLYAGYTKVTVDGSAVSNAAYAKTTASVNLRKGAGTGSSKVTVAPKGTKLFYLGSSAKDGNGRTWYRVACAYGPAWVSSKYATLSGGSASSGDKVVTTGNAWLRKGAGLGYSKIAAIPEGTTVAYLGSSSTDGRGVKWYKVKYDGNTGWVSSKYSKIK
jgi:uncharacterized protein YraI